MTPIEKNLLAIKNQIHADELRYQRKSGSVALLAVSKGHPASSIATAYAAGQHAFGENYLQEALEKILALEGKHIEWHFIGPLQSNKTKKIAEHFHWVHSVSDIKTAIRLNEQRPEHLPPLNICLQVNISHDPNKSGAHPNDVAALIQHCSEFLQLRLRGLMALPTEKKIFSEQCNEYHKLRVLWENLREKGFILDTLSMGMSNDLSAAIAEGSTMVRIGAKIFGYRG